MSTAQLLEISDPVTYGFDHAMNHRPWIGVWSSERQGYAQIPYWVGQRYGDPVHDTPEWRLRHAQAHWDTLYAPADPVGPFSAPVGQNLWWTGPSSKPDQSKWWVFANWQEHVLVEQNMAKNQYELFFPFW